MHDLLLIWKNATQHSTRFLLVVLSVALCVAMFCLLLSFDRAMKSSASFNDSRHLVMVNALSFDHPVPARYLERVAELDGVERVFPVTWFGGNNEAAPGLITGYATHIDAYAQSYASRFNIPVASVQAMAEMKSGIIVGADLARRMGWSVGQSVIIKSRRFERSNGSKDWDFQIVGLFEGQSAGADTNFFLFSNTYFNDARRDFKWMVGSLTVEPSADANLADLTERLDQSFATDETATRTVSELEFAQSFISQLGNVSLAIRIVVTGAYCTIFLIAANMIAMTIRQRSPSIGVLKAIGFANGRVVSMVVAESIMIFMFGAFLGVLIGAILVMGLQQVLVHIVPNMSLQLETVGMAVLICLVLGLTAGAVPAMKTTKITVQAALIRK